MSGDGGWFDEHQVEQPLQFAAARPSLPLDDEGWVRVTGGRLPQPVWLQISAMGSRLTVTGLVVGGTNGAELTTEALRRIRPRQLLEHLLRRVEQLPADDDVLGQPFDEWLALRRQTDAAPSAPSTPRRPGVGATDQELQGFAVAYLNAFQRQPHRAMTAAAASCNISRATANRWATLCRAQGLLPKTEDR